MNPDSTLVSPPRLAQELKAAPSNVPWSAGYALLGLLAATGSLRLLQTLIFSVHLSSAEANATLFTIGASGLLFGITIVLARKVTGDVRGALGLLRPQAGDVAFGILLGIGLYFATGALQTAINEQFSTWVGWYAPARESVDLAQGPWIAVSLVQVVVAPIAEESLFRGFFYRGLRARYSVLGSVVISAAVFAVYHVDPAIMPAIFIDGIALALIFEWRRNLAAPIFAHATILACFLIQGLMQ